MSTTNLTSWTHNSLGRILAKKVSRYLEDKEHRREFELWYEKTYGKKYVWKKGSDLPNGNTKTSTPC